MSQFRKSAMQIAAIGGNTPVAAPLLHAGITTMTRLDMHRTGETGSGWIFGRVNSLKPIDGHSRPRIMKGIEL
jgi:hypothetical protein